MVITDYLEQNEAKFPNDTALVEIIPSIISEARVTWKEYSLIPPNSEESGRTEISWQDFNRNPPSKSFANDIVIVAMIQQIILHTAHAKSIPKNLSSALRGPAVSMLPSTAKINFKIKETITNSAR